MDASPPIRRCSTSPSRRASGSTLRCSDCSARPGVTRPSRASRSRMAARSTGSTPRPTVIRRVFDDPDAFRLDRAQRGAQAPLLRRRDLALSRCRAGPARGGDERSRARRAPARSAHRRRRRVAGSSRHMGRAQPAGVLVGSRVTGEHREHDLLRARRADRGGHRWRARASAVASAAARGRGRARCRQRHRRRAARRHRRQHRRRRWSATAVPATSARARGRRRCSSPRVARRRRARRRARQQRRRLPAERSLPHARRGRSGTRCTPSTSSTSSGCTHAIAAGDGRAGQRQHRERLDGRGASAASPATRSTPRSTPA